MPGRGCSKTKKCGHTTSIPTPRPKQLRSSRAARSSWSCTQAQPPVNCRVLSQAGQVPYAWRGRFAGKNNRDPPHPHRPNARPGRHWSLYDGRGERCTEGHQRPRAGPCGRSEATESRCRMAAAHGASGTPIAVHVGPSAARSQELCQLSDSVTLAMQPRPPFVKSFATENRSLRFLHRWKALSKSFLTHVSSHPDSHRARRRVKMRGADTPVPCKQTFVSTTAFCGTHVL